jgi:chemotaxis protein methyltransferase CheR
MNRKLTDDELSMVCEAIASRMGLHFPVERWAMLRRNLVLAAREFGFHDMTGFIQWLLSAPLNKEQTDILAAHLTISETYFWREPQVFTALTDYILPELIRSKSREQGAGSKEQRERSIRIWSAGCSTGEEPYSIAIALKKTIQKIEDWNITILATDINPKALEKAVAGIYGTWSFRNSPAWLRSTWFHNKEDRQYEIIPEIKKMVTFSCLSLVEMSAIGNVSAMDIIFCRNVLMYFTKEWVTKISQNLFNSLSEDGWFVVSSSELSSWVFPQFTPVNFPGAVLYRKGKNGSAYSCDIPSDEMPEPSSDTAFLTTEVSPKRVVKEVAKVVAKEDIVNTPEESYTDKIFAIRLLANLGHLAEALSLCNEAIASEKLTPGLYFLRASILQELDNSSEAIASLKKAIYIDPDYVMGHFALGNLYNRQGNDRNAKQHFNNVLDLLNNCSNDDILPESEGLSVKYIREIIFANMQILGTK